MARTHIYLYIIHLHTIINIVKELKTVINHFSLAAFMPDCYNNIIYRHANNNFAIKHVSCSMLIVITCDVIIKSQYIIICCQEPCYNDVCFHRLTTDNRGYITL